MMFLWSTTGFCWFSPHRLKRTEVLTGRTTSLMIVVVLSGLSAGSMGTGGRVCSRTSRGVDSCEVMCCGRGYHTSRLSLTVQCECKFHWCCAVHCRDCQQQVDVHTCKGQTWPSTHWAHLDLHSICWIIRGYNLKLFNEQLMVRGSFSLFLTGQQEESCVKVRTSFILVCKNCFIQLWARINTLRHVTNNLQLDWEVYTHHEHDAFIFKDLFKRFFFQEEILL